MQISGLIIWFRRKWQEEMCAGCSWPAQITFHPNMFSVIVGIHGCGGPRHVPCLQSRGCRSAVQALGSGRPGVPSSLHHSLVREIHRSPLWTLTFFLVEQEEVTLSIEWHRFLRAESDMVKCSAKPSAYKTRNKISFLLAWGHTLHLTLLNSTGGRAGGRVLAICWSPGLSVITQPRVWVAMTLPWAHMLLS